MRVKTGNKEKDILEAAIRVFAKNGYHGAKMAKIAEESNVSIGTLYLYYVNKEDLLVEVFENLWKSLYNELEALANRVDFSVTEKLDHLIDVFFDIFSSNSDLATVFVNEQHLVMRNPEVQVMYYHDFMSKAELIIYDGQKGGSINPNLNVKALRFFILGGIRNLLEVWALEPRLIPLPIMRNNIKTVIKNGLIHKN
ncbi:MAG: TetR/AcrR family transcriptional regulator [Ignavibacteria bacterium]|nr:TetR/AcrR family transcriptional regulator [Ignavibacteria bacterium]